MMKTILFDPFSGASGDMMIACLIDLGADADKVRVAIESAADVEVEVTRTTKKGIAATAISVSTKKDGNLKLSGIIGASRNCHLVRI